MVSYFLCSILLCQGESASAQSGSVPTEIHDRIQTSGVSANQVALTFDACSGAYDDDLVRFLIRNRIPATLFVTKKWLLHNPQGIGQIKTAPRQ